MDLVIVLLRKAEKGNIYCSKARADEIQELLTEDEAHRGCRRGFLHTFAVVVLICVYLGPSADNFSFSSSG